MRSLLPLVLAACGGAPQARTTIGNEAQPAAGNPSRNCHLADAAAIVIATGTGATPASSPVGDRPGDDADFRAFLRLDDYDLFMPYGKHPRVCLHVSEVLHGRPIGSEPCFLRASGLTLVSEVADDTGEAYFKPHLWILNRHERGFLWATDAGAMQPEANRTRILDLVRRGRLDELCPRDAEPTMPALVDVASLTALVTRHGTAATPVLEQLLAHGTLEQQVAVLTVTEELGFVPLVAALIAKVTDETPLPTHTTRTTLGEEASWALASIGAALEIEQRAIEFVRRSRKVPLEKQREVWTMWWNYVVRR